MNRPSICWSCMHKDDCKKFKKNPDAKVTDCGRFLIMSRLQEINNLICKIKTAEKYGVITREEKKSLILTDIAKSLAFIADTISGKDE